MSRANDIVLALIDRLGDIGDTGAPTYESTVVGVDRGFTPRWRTEDGLHLYIVREELVQVTPGAHQQSRAQLQIDIWAVGATYGDNAQGSAEVLIAMEDICTCIWNDMYLNDTLKTYGGRIHPSAAVSNAEMSERCQRFIGVVTLLCTYQPTSR